MSIDQPKNVILGTAGHIDHGKSSLVKALTGVDPDRLKEEKERGITIDLGFANLSYPDGLTVGIVDVPGHERLIKNMLAGAGGIDIVAMVIAADEGVMPQSREHLAICELLKIKSGIVVVTKADLVDADWLALVQEDLRNFVKNTFLENAEIVAVSAKTGMNIGLLRDRIRQAAANVRPKLMNGLFRLPIDRVFTLKGFGTVVTGTALAGSISVDAPVEILPSRVTSKVRGLQSHGKGVQKAFAGQRIGLNLQGVDKELLRRGDTVVSSERLVPTQAIDAKLELLKGAPTLKTRSSVHFYTGTSETIARVVLYGRDEAKAGESCYCQFRLEGPVVVLSGDRYIIRRFSPLETIGGGQILDPYPVKRKRSMGIEDLIVFEQGTVSEKIETKIKRSGLFGCKLNQIEGWLLGDIPEIRLTVDGLIKKGEVVKCGDILFHRDGFNKFKEFVMSTLNLFHKENPLKAGMAKEDLRAKAIGGLKNIADFDSLIGITGEVAIEKELVRLRSFSPSAAETGSGTKSRILPVLDKEAFQPPTRQELAAKLGMNEKELADILKLLAKEGSLVRINDSIYITKELHDKMLALLKGFFAGKQEMTVAEFRDILNTTRKYALPFLEYLDTNRMTLRVGDVRKFMLK
ncbi:MAG: selenocysteine-specific translation elongation factor [Nitrospirae bacterium]|nr:MAG: selenocysteine-specific translation elongation factor [Nitrospirota bacterium]